MGAVLSCSALEHLRALLEDDQRAGDVFMALARHVPLETIRSIERDPISGEPRVVEARSDDDPPSLVVLEGEAARKVLDDLATFGGFVSWSWNDAPDDMPVFGLPGFGVDVQGLRADPVIAPLLFVGTKNPNFHWFGELGDLYGLGEDGERFVQMAERHRLVTVFK